MLLGCGISDTVWYLNWGKRVHEHKISCTHQEKSCWIMLKPIWSQKNEEGKDRMRWGVIHGLGLGGSRFSSSSAG